MPSFQPVLWHKNFQIDHLTSGVDNDYFPQPFYPKLKSSQLKVKNMSSSLGLFETKLMPVEATNW